MWWQSYILANNLHLKDEVSHRDAFMQLKIQEIFNVHIFLVCNIYLKSIKTKQDLWLLLYLPIPVPFSELGLLRVVEPLYSDHHVAGPGFPKTLNETNEGEMGPTSREENCTVANLDGVFPPNNGLVEELPSFSFQTPSLVTRKWSLRDSFRNYNHPFWTGIKTEKSGQEITWVGFPDHLHSCRPGMNEDELGGPSEDGVFCFLEKSLEDLDFTTEEELAISFFLWGFPVPLLTVVFELEIVIVLAPKVCRGGAVGSSGCCFCWRNVWWEERQPWSRRRDASSSSEL